MSYLSYLFKNTPVALNLCDSEHSLHSWAKITNSYKLSDNELREYLQLLLMKPHMLIKYPPNTVIRSACGMTAVCLFNTILLCGAMLF